MRVLAKRISGLTLVLAIALPGVASAELFGLLNGRSADLSRAPDRSFEAGVGLYEYDESDFEHFGARFNYKLNPATIIYGDVGQSSVDFGNEADGITFGLGGFWQMDGLSAGTDFAVHASFHLFDLDIDGFSNALEGNTIVVEGLFSSKEPINAAGSMYFNGSIGFVRIDSEFTNTNNSDTETELTFSGGIVLETQGKTGEFYGGLLYVDDIGFGAGYRHFLQ